MLGKLSISKYKSGLKINRFFFIVPDLDGQHDRKFFRDDYAYLQETRSFYKVHSSAKTWVDAKRLCALEGSKLFYPDDLNEVNVVLSYLDRKQPATPTVFVGISSRLAKGVFLTVDGEFLLIL